MTQSRRSERVKTWERIHLNDTAHKIFICGQYVLFERLFRLSDRFPNWSVRRSFPVSTFYVAAATITTIASIASMPWKYQYKRNNFLSSQSNRMSLCILFSFRMRHGNNNNRSTNPTDSTHTRAPNQTARSGIEARWLKQQAKRAKHTVQTARNNRVRLGFLRFSFYNGFVIRYTFSFVASFVCFFCWTFVSPSPYIHILIGCVRFVLRVCCFLVVRLMYFIWAIIL